MRDADSRILPGGKTSEDSSLERETKTRWETQRRFYPALDSLIDKVRVIDKPKLCTKVLLKSYALVVGCGHNDWTCACGEFSASCMYAAQRLGCKSSDIANAVGRMAEDGQIRYARFVVDELAIEPAIKRAHMLELSVQYRIRLSMRIGMCMTSMLQITAHSLSRNAVIDTLENFMVSDTMGLRLAQYYFEDALVKTPAHIALAAERVRFGVDVEKPTAFGNTVWKQMNKLLAAGHSREL